MKPRNIANIKGKAVAKPTKSPRRQKLPTQVAPAKKKNSDADVHDERLAKMATSASVNAAAAMEPWAKPTFGEPSSIDALILVQRANCELMIEGDLTGVEATLYGQAQALQVIFTNLARRAARQEYVNQLQTYLVLALKAQAQSRATLQTLAEIKNPRPVAFVAQANISNGPQQVNNGLEQATRAEELANSSNELSKEDYGLLQNTSASSAAGGANKKLETVGAVNGTTNRKG